MLMIYPEVTKKKRVRGNVIVNIFRPIQMFFVCFLRIFYTKNACVTNYYITPISGVYPACTIIAFA